MVTHWSMPPILPTEGGDHWPPTAVARSTLVPAAVSAASAIVSGSIVVAGNVGTALATLPGTLEPGATIGSVAFQVGYGTPFALSTAFKRVRGVTPQQHRLAAAAGASGGPFNIGTGVGTNVNDLYLALVEES